MYDLILEEQVTQTHTLQAMYDLILEERVTQGYWLTGLELAVEQVPSEEAQWTMVRVGVCVRVSSGLWCVAGAWQVPSEVAQRTMVRVY
jgi:hypothetical protein